MTFYDSNGYNNTQDNIIWVMPAGVNATPIAAGATTATVVNANPGIFYGILITSVAAGTPHIHDNATVASGTTVGQVAASAPLGISQFISQGVRCVNGITVSGGATNPGMTIYWM
jgi:hypothetical protein